MPCFPVCVLPNCADLADQGQGGSQAIEDAEAVAVALENASPEDIPRQLKKVEKIRYNRASFVQKCSRDMAHGPGVDNAGKQQKLDGYKFARVHLSTVCFDNSIYIVILERVNSCGNWMLKRLYRTESNKSYK
jgi:hypothetical protein